VSDASGYSKELLFALDSSMITRSLFLAVLCAVGPGSLHAQEPRRAIAVDVFLPVMSPVSRLLGEDMTFVPLYVMYRHVLTH
jgi:hypothetical protein